MNVLIFVMTLLMLLSLMTYARLETYRSSQVFQGIFKYYMENDERGYFNAKADAIYDSIKVSSKEGKSGPKAEGSPRLSIYLLLNKKERESKEEAYKQMKVLLKNLLSELYEDQPFYRAAIEKNPSMPDDLINAIEKAANDLPKEKKLKTAADLANLKLQDKDLDNFLYKILQGAVYHDVNDLKNENVETETEDGKESVTKEVEEQDDETLSNELLEFKSAKGYYSLLDYITGLNTSKIRVYLASEQVLNAIFPKPVVQNILSERKEYFKKAMNGDDMKELSEEFKNQFDKLKDANITDESLNFTVTKTNPKSYD